MKLHNFSVEAHGIALQKKRQQRQI